jgi:hypothetical protein
MLLKLFAEYFSELIELGLNNELTVWVTVAVYFHVLLVIILGRIKDGKRADFSYDRIVPGAGAIQGYFVGLGLLALLLIMIKYTTSVLRAYVVALSVKGSGIMGFPKYF